uniref:Odorant receptor n=1 Tax=Ctenopseustis obliquana TaxID=65030 RepID=A0A097IYM4_9NEOP|nr:olfactory receptor 45b [Ctenopseustis obliquana]
MDAFDLRYMKRIRFTLRTIGAWPNHVFEDLPTSKLAAISRYGYTSFLFTICCIGMVAQAVYLVNNKGTLPFIDLGQSCLTLLCCIVYIGRTMLPLQTAYQELIKKFASKFHLIHHKNMTDFSAKMYDKVNKICEIATIVEHIQLYMAAFMFNIAPLYLNYSAGMLSLDRPVNATFDHSVYYALPVDPTDGFWFTIICVYNWYVSYNLACVFTCQDLQICVFVFHIWGHLTIFEHNLNYFPRPRIHVGSKTEPLRYSNEEKVEVAAELKDIIKHYIMIKQFVVQTSDTYSVTLCVYLGFHLVSDCILLLECSPLEIDALVKFGFMTVALYQQLIQVSVVFELISSKGDGLADAVYGLPWECMDDGNRRTVLILLQVVQQSLPLKACGMVPIGVQTMLAILKASFSYFLMLRTFANN